MSLGWTGSSEHTFAEVARILVYAAVVALALLGLNRYTWRAAALGLGAAAVGICVVALLSRLSPGTFDDPIAAVFHTDRLSYPLNYWNAVACWGAMTLAMGLAWSANSRRIVVRGAGLAATPIAALTVYLTYSRGGRGDRRLSRWRRFSPSRATAGPLAFNVVAAAMASAAVILVARGQPAIAHATGSAGARPVALALVAACAACAVVALVTRRGAARRGAPSPSACPPRGSRRSDRGGARDRWSAAMA